MDHHPLFLFMSEFHAKFVKGLCYSIKNQSKTWLLLQMYEIMNFLLQQETHQSKIVQKKIELINHMYKKWFPCSYYFDRSNNFHGCVHGELDRYRYCKYCRKVKLC